MDEPALLTSWWRTVLASAYELTEAQVDTDATHVQLWAGADPELVAELESVHGWAPADELGHHYLAALRRALI